MPKLVIVTPPVTAVPSVFPSAHATTACGQVLVTPMLSFAASLLSQIPAVVAPDDEDQAATAYEPLLAAMREAPEHGAHGASALLDVIDELTSRSEAAPEHTDEQRAHEALEQQATYTAIKALAQLAARQPQALCQSYMATRSLAALDALCEAASASRIEHPLLLQLQLNHLQRNTSVAALCLAQYGHEDARPALLAALKHEVNHWQHEDQSASKNDLGSLHLEALLEALDSFEPEIPALWRARAEAIVARLRGRVSAFQSMLHVVGPQERQL